MAGADHFSRLVSLRYLNALLVEAETGVSVFGPRLRIEARLREELPIWASGPAPRCINPVATRRWTMYTRAWRS